MVEAEYLQQASASPLKPMPSLQSPENLIRMQIMWYRFLVTRHPGSRHEGNSEHRSPIRIRDHPNKNSIKNRMECTINNVVTK
jgi:hypothetical protein